MASITNAGHSAAARWTLTALLRRLQPSPRPSVSPQIVAEVATEVTGVAGAAPTTGRTKRRYPAQRDSVFEQSAMAREMFRL